MARNLIVTALAVLVLGACGTLGRLGEYGLDMSDALFRHDGAAFTISVHPREDTFLIRPGAMEGLGRSLARGVSLGFAGRPPGYEASRAAAAYFIEPSGCEISRFQDLDASTGYWEADYACPPGVDLRAMVMAQRSSLRGGVRLDPEGV